KCDETLLSLFRSAHRLPGGRQLAQCGGSCREGAKYATASTRGTTGARRYAQRRSSAWVATDFGLGEGRDRAQGARQHIGSMLLSRVRYSQLMAQLTSGLYSTFNSPKRYGLFDRHHVVNEGSLREAAERLEVAMRARTVTSLGDN